MKKLIDVGCRKCPKEIQMCYHIMKILKDKAEDMLNCDDVLYERNYLIAFAYYMGKCYHKKIGRSNVLVNGEVYKTIDMDNKTMKDSYDNLKYSNMSQNFVFVPDFIVHGNNDSNFAPDKQKLIIEAKTTTHLSKKGFLWDFYKLNVYLSKLKYQNASYIIVNTKKERVENLINSYFDAHHFKSRDITTKLWVIIQEQIRVQPKIYKITNV